MLMERGRLIPCGWDMMKMVCNKTAVYSIKKSRSQDEEERVNQIDSSGGVEGKSTTRDGGG